MGKSISLAGTIQGSNRKWVLASLITGTGSAMLCFVLLINRQYQAADFTWPYRAAQELIGGRNPYHTIQPAGPYPFNDTFNYPILAAWFAIPFTAVEPYAAGALFFGAGSALMAYAVFSRRPHAWPVFFSASFYISAWAAQWSPWIFAAALLIPAQWLALMKPNIGLAAVLYRTNARAIILLLCVLLGSILLFPNWLPGFLGHSLAASQYRAPFFVSYGWLLLLSGLKVRKPEGRVFFSLSIAPQLLYFYDQILVWLVPITEKRAVFLSLMSWVGYAVLHFFCSFIPEAENCVYILADPVIIWSIYYPALAVLFWPDHISAKIHQACSVFYR